MKRSHLVIAVVVAALAAALVYLLAFRGGDGGQPGAPAGAPDRGSGVGKVVPGAGGAGRDAAPTALSLGIDPPDPAGALRLEGQVLDETDQPVGGATVFLSSQPPRSMITEDDGTFAFDRLLPHEYSVSARHGDAVGGPVIYRLGPEAQPIVVRLRQGATLRVTVTAADGGAAIPGATVSLSEDGEPTETTGADGVATFKGVGSGWSMVIARADGYAPAQLATTIGASGSTQQLAIALRKGAPLSGKVVDEAGAPVPGALVTLRDVGAFVGDRDSTASADDGAFTFAVVPPGSYTVGARDAEHAPATSEIVTVDGKAAKTDVIVVMKAGGVVRGRVVTAQKAPAPFASVQVAPRELDQSGWDGSVDDRRITADDQGRFEIKALPRTPLRLRASSEDAASAVTDVDLSATGTVDGIELVLDVTGVIAGVVVDAAGEPVAEAQVSAFADFWGSGGELKMEDMVLAGLAGTTTDGGGAFRLTGLPDGSYRLWASRTSAGSSMFVTEGTGARTGDTDVRIVLPAPGGLEGKVAFADGSSPEVASVQLGMMPPTPTRDGAFELRDVPPAKYDLRVRGPEFAELVVRDVEVEAGVVTDLGALTVKRGRRVSGRVVDASGNPVEGARVVVGEILFSEGGAASSSMEAIETQMGVKKATTAADGSFTVTGAPEKGGSVMAEHPDRGRSDAIPLAAGTDDALGLTLNLRGFGSVAGKVTMEGEPMASVQVMASSKASTGHVVVVVTGPDGAFVIDKIPEGEHRLTATRMQNLQMRGSSVDVVVQAGQRATADIEIPVGKVTLTVEVKGKSGAKLDGAQVFLFRGRTSAANAKQITERFLAGGAAGMGFWMGGATFPSFDKLVPGTYSACTLPINGNLSDPTFGQRLQEHLEDLLVYCQAVEVTEAPEQQRHVAIVPAMKPLPSD